MFALGYGSRAIVGAQATAQPQMFDLTQITSAQLKEVAPGVRLKPLASTASGDVDVVEITSVPAHRHDNTDELIYVLSGNATAMVAGKSYSVGPGQLVVLPRGTPHSIKSSGTLRVLGVAYPKDDPKDMQMMKSP
jgi:mannose-6-phosphate isomerase-like protein (cupin superfamily)